MNTLPFFQLINGIRTKPGDQRAWLRRAERYIEDGGFGFADSYDYYTPGLGRQFGFDNHVDLLGGILLGRCTTHADVRVVTHSYGGHLICGALKKFPRIKLSALHLIAPATDADFTVNGLNDAIADGQVGRIYLYGSDGDWALWWGRLSRKAFGFAGLGYGSLGLDGPKNMSRDAAAKLTPEWRANGFGHSDWFLPENFDNTMQLLLRG